jgi:hypothetical protein
VGLREREPADERRGEERGEQVRRGQGAVEALGTRRGEQERGGEHDGGCGRLGVDPDLERAPRRVVTELRQLDDEARKRPLQDPHRSVGEPRPVAAAAEGCRDRSGRGTADRTADHAGEDRDRLRAVELRGRPEVDRLGDRDRGRGDQEEDNPEVVDLAVDEDARERGGAGREERERGRDPPGAAKRRRAGNRSAHPESLPEGTRPRVPRRREPASANGRFQWDRKERMMSAICASASFAREPAIESST